MFSQCIRCFKLLDNGSFCPHCGFNNAAYVPEPHHLPPGTVIRERYGIGIALGEGGFGITYAGYDFVLTRRIAIKEYYPGNAVWRDPSKSLNVTCRTSQNLYEEFELGRQKCIHEAQSLANLDDIPGIVRIIDFFQENNTAYIIMEFVEGVTLRRYAQGLPQRMTVAEAAALLRPVTDALEKVHKRGFVHRDISPDNIMITEDDTAKLLDFGAVKSVSSGGSATEHPIVKRGYSPVELYSTTGLIGPWTDVYALAATIVFLTTGTAPEEPTNRMVNDPLPQMLDGICMPAEKAALLHALSVQPQSRPQSVAAFMSELQSAPQYTAAPQTSAFRAAQPQQPDPGRTMPIQQDTGRTMPIQQDADRTMPLRQDTTGRTMPMQQDAERTMPLRQNTERTMPMQPDAGHTMPVQPEPFHTTEPQKKPKRKSGKIIAAVLAVLLIGGAVAIGVSVLSDDTPEVTESVSASETKTETTAASGTTRAESTTKKTDDDWDADIKTIHVPTRKFSGTPDYQDNIISIYKPAGLNRVSDKTLQENDVNVDVYYADIEEGDSLYSNTEMLSLCIKTVDGDGHFGEERVKEITKDYPHGIDEYIVSLMKQDMEKDDDYYEGTYSFSDIYRMRVGKQTWYCYDLEFSSGAVRTRAYAYFGDYINLLESYSDFGTDRARELMHYYVNTIG